MFASHLVIDRRSRIGQTPALARPENGFTAHEELGSSSFLTSWWARLDGPATLQTHHSRVGLRRIARAPALETSEAAVAARVGFATALVELETAGLDTVSARLGYLADTLRDALADLPHWRLREPVSEGTPLVIPRRARQHAT